MFLVDGFDGPLLIGSAREDTRECGGDFWWVFIVIYVLGKYLVNGFVLEGYADGGQLVHHPGRC